jgi:small subunit ribosomal protein S11
MAQKKKKVKRVGSSGVVHIYSTFNNTIITITNENGDTISWASGGTVGYKGTKKSTPFAAQLAAKQAAEKAIQQGLKEVKVIVKGPGMGRESAIRALRTAGLEITDIKDATPVPHNGCRPPSRRRV